MPFRTVAALAVFAALASAQPQEQTRTFSFANAQAPRQMQEIVNAIRSIGEIRDVTVDPTQRAIAVAGNSDQIALASWLFPELDRPSGASELTIHENTFNDQRAPAVRVYYPAHLSTPLQLQEFINAVRSTGEVQRAIVVTEVPAMVLRGAPEQIAYADWLARELDQAAASGGRGVRTYDYADTMMPAARRATAIRIYYPTIALSPYDLQETVNAVRSICDVTRVVGITQPRAIVLRSGAEQAAMADWLFQQLDQPVASTAAREFGLPEGVVHIVAIPKTADPLLTYTRVRETGMKRVVYISRTRSLALRGTLEQLSAAEATLR